MNQIFNIDCLSYTKSMDSESVDLIVTDPPYLARYKTNHRKDKNHKFCNEIQNDNNPKLLTDLIPELHRVLKNDAALYMFCRSDEVEFFKSQLQKYFKIKNIIIWVKNNWTAGDLSAQYGKQYEMIIYANKGRRKLEGRRETDVWFYDRVVGKKQIHQNQKPLDLIKRIITNSSKVDDLIYDPFMGSGTTAIAAIQQNRNYVGCEIDNAYYTICQENIKQFGKEVIDNAC